MPESEAFEGEAQEIRQERRELIRGEASIYDAPDETPAPRDRMPSSVMDSPASYRQGGRTRTTARSTTYAYGAEATHPYPDAVNLTGPAQPKRARPATGQLALSRYVTVFEQPSDEEEEEEESEDDQGQAENLDDIDEDEAEGRALGHDEAEDDAGGNNGPSEEEERHSEVDEEDADAMEGLEDEGQQPRRDQRQSRRQDDLEDESQQQSRYFLPRSLSNVTPEQCLHGPIRAFHLIDLVHQVAGSLASPRPSSLHHQLMDAATRRGMAERRSPSAVKDEDEDEEARSRLHTGSTDFLPRSADRPSRPSAQQCPAAISKKVIGHQDWHIARWNR
ncbi:hypothetical protein BT63DRAFT_441617 [Microthyrium microscopicum]|uniref:Uncharacterized protein n=1 Tax=Microthyrium microscopicum TaxID=703497 RepID=A0A6A6UAG2_9PEZI|nr:hypothetical protein BT63DRAFT_441617 [Microthyrium microscopicum]